MNHPEKFRPRSTAFRTPLDKGLREEGFKTNKLVEALGDILVFAARLEARLPVNSEVMKVLLCDNLFKTLVQKVVVGSDDELKLETHCCVTSSAAWINLSTR